MTRLAPHEPIAIVGIGCRLPGGIDGPRSFWQALLDELDVVGEVDPSRWDVDALFHPDRDRPGTTYARAAAQLADVDRFDAAFFHIAPQEASRVDPQHRLLLEVAWEALEDAGTPPSSLAGRPVGVFIGQSFQEYLALQEQDLRGENAYTMMGGASCMAANRLSYVLDLRGPSATVDTACASGLTAIHAACRGIVSGECDLALAGGVNISLVPGGFVGFSRAQMLSPTGRCRSFSADADGYVRGEGVGVVVLKPLSRALADGDRVYAVVRATGINHHGRSQGITFPGVEAQEALLRRTVERAGLEPGDVQYVEAHGTGTQAGDPVEATAIGRALGQGRPAEAPLRIGSVKSNVGHPEAAAGVIGLIKLALAIEHAHLPASLHAREPNPAIPFAALGLRVTSVAEPWPATDEPRRGVVSAFGFGGANACAVLEESPPATRAPGALPPGPHLLPLSARSPEALRALGLAWAGMLSDVPDASPADLAHTTAFRRDHHEHRVAFTFRDVDDLAGQLGGWLRGEPSPVVHEGRVRGGGPKVAFAFCGNGPQWWGMARGLLATEPVFRATLERCAAAFAAIDGFDLFAELARDEATTRMRRTDVAQPAIFAVQLGLCELLASWGVRPAAVVGHSAGEIAAAHVCGALDFDDAVRVIVERSRAQQSTEGSGRLAAAGITPEEGERLVAPFGGRVCVSAQNGPRQITLSGELEALRAVGGVVQASGAFWREIPMDYAFHSPAMEVVRGDLLAALDGIRPRRPTLPFYSTVSGRHEPDAWLDEGYWWRNLRQPVLFAPAAQALARDGLDVVVEIGPHPALRAYLAETAEAAGATLLALPTLQRKADDRERIAQALAALYAAGYPIDFAPLAARGRFVSAPTYAWQRERHWHEPAADGRAGAGRVVHPLLGRRVVASRPEWRVELDTAAQPWIADHVVGGSTVFPGAGYVEQCLAVAAEAFGPGAVAVERLEIDKALVVPEEGVTVSVSFDPATGGVDIHGVDAQATGHARAEVRRDFSDDGALDLAEIRARCGERWSGAQLRGLLADRGLALGPTFAGVEALARRDGEALGTIALPPELVAAGADGASTRFHPALLDACFQTILAAMAGGRTMYVPVAIERFVLRGPVPARLYSHATVETLGANALRAHLVVADAAGRVVARVEGLVARAVDLGGPRADDLVHAVTWRPQPRDAAPVAPDAGAASGLAANAASTPLAVELLAGYRARALPDEDALCADYVAVALGRLGFRPRVGERVTTPGLVASLRVADAHARQLGRLLEFLAEDGVLERSGDGFVVARPLPTPDLAARFRAAWSASPAGHAQLELTHRVGLRLAELLRGEIDPLSLLFGDTASATMEEIYDASPGQWFGNAAVRAVVEAIRAVTPIGRRLDVLEVGAGTGGLTGWLLPALGPDRARYRFTDVTDAFAPAARARFAEHTFVEYDRLDVEAPEERHVAEPADVIVASNVLHATRDARRTLANLRRLLRPGGYLVFVEVAPGVRAVELVYGFLPGWWRAEDASLRPSSPLLPAEKWRSLAEEAGFAEAALATDDAQARAVSVVVARAPAASTAPRAVAPRADGAWLLLADEGGLADELAVLLAGAGARVHLARGSDRFSPGADTSLVRPDEPGDLARVLAAVDPDGDTLAGVVHLWALDAGDGEAGLAHLETAGCLGTASLLRASSERAATPRLFVVTRGARAVARGEAPSPIQAALWGVGRSVMLEHPGLRATLVDLDPAGGGGRALLHELLAPGTDPLEQAIALRGDERLVERLARAGVEEAAALTGDVEAFRLERVRPGTVAGLALVEAERRPPGLGEVEIEVHAAGLNFRDVLFALDALPSRESPPEIGIECAGVVRGVGAGVTGLRAGDEVMAVASGTMARFVTTRAANVARTPAGMGLTAAATLPATFATAVYALRHLGNLRRGERLLVHGAAGALGLAAVQLARAVGAEVYATAGTPEKRELLRELGATRVMDSRSLAFADEIREATGGEGVDVVLNSLAGEALVRGLSVLKPLGRFLEVGKRDFFENGRLGFRLLQQRSFHAIDLDKVIALAPDLTRALLDEVRALAEAGTIAPLPHRVFPLARASEAFATMLRSRHVGKLVIETRDPRVPVREAARPVAVRPDGTYVVTGGLGGFGLAAAEWLARQGAGRVVLVGRRGPTAEQRAKVEALGAWGSEVLVRAADVSDAAAIARILDAIRSGGPPLRGVIHAAMVLDDGMLMNAGRERVARVLAPKVRGAANLDAATRADPLDFFVCCSSVAGLLGNPGQAVYAGANTFLDALCQRRRAEGRPGLSVSLGAIADTGFVARTAGLPEALAARGMVAFEAREALELLGRLLGASRAHVGLFRYDWSRYAGSSALVAELADERRATARAASEAGETDLRARIAAGDGDERRRLLHERLSWHVSRILGVGGAGLDPDRPLVDMGLDSLMSVDLQHFIGASFGAEVPVMSILQGWSIARLAAEIDRRLGGAPESAA